MNLLLLLMLVTQPVLPELPPPAQPQVPTEQPVVIGLGQDTLSIQVLFGKPFGFGALARRDGEVISVRTRLGACERADHFQGLQRSAAAELAGNLGAVQLRSETQAASFSPLDNREDRFYGEAYLSGLWHGSGLLTSLKLGGYASSLPGTRRKGGRGSLRLFTELPWGRLLSRTQISVEPPGLGVVTEAYTQHQLGFVLITPKLEARFLPEEPSPWGWGAGLCMIAVVGSFSILAEGRYQEMSMVILDSVLAEPVQAVLDTRAERYTLTDEARAGIGFHGVEVFLFAQKGKGLFWLAPDSLGFPRLSSRVFSRTGTEVNLKLERDYFSNVGTMYLVFSEPCDWIPPFKIIDSLSVNLGSITGFGILEVGGERTTDGYSDAGYTVLGCGVSYRREPFLFTLRADDLLDRRPMRFPGLADGGRRFSFLVSLFELR